jgi:hypothetical protein
MSRSWPSARVGAPSDGRVLDRYSRGMNDDRWRPGDPVNWERPGALWTAGGLHAFVVESIGRQTGRRRRAVLGYLDDGPDWLIIGSKGGAPTNPAWVYNLGDNRDATVVLADAHACPSKPSG